MKSICVITGSRAEYGLLRPLISKIYASHDLKLQLVVTGSHLSELYGMTVNEIVSDGFKIDYQVDLKIFLDEPLDIIKIIGMGLNKFGVILKKLQPDIIVILGDRYELLCPAISSLFLGYPIAHIHGGEITEGAIDDTIRHILTKLSHLHFVATDQNKTRVQQMGEMPETVFCVGGLGVDAISHMNLLSKIEVEKRLNITFNKKNLLVTYHPVTNNRMNELNEFQNLLSVLEEIQDVLIIFTLPNADQGNKILISELQKYVRKNQNCKLFSSLGQLNYFSCLQYVDAVVGNSSSGLLEAPSFKIATVNIGERQKGRPLASSVIQSGSSKEEIRKSIDYIFSKSFINQANQVENPYGKSGATDAILEVLKKTNLKKLTKKKFFDIFSVL